MSIFCVILLTNKQTTDENITSLAEVMTASGKFLVHKLPDCDRQKDMNLLWLIRPSVV